MYQPANTSSAPQFIFRGQPPTLDPLRAAINELFLADETRCVDALLAQAKLDDKARAEIQARAKMLVETVRKNRSSKGGIEEFLRQYDLSSQEGMVLMSLAEAFLRAGNSFAKAAAIKEHWRVSPGFSSMSSCRAPRTSPCADVVFPSECECAGS